MGKISKQWRQVAPERAGEIWGAAYGEYLEEIMEQGWESVQSLPAEEVLFEKKGI